MNGKSPVVLLTVLPTERRARHPYQLCMMLALITLGLSQIIFGPAPTSAVRLLSEHNQFVLNLWCVLGGCCGIAASIIPERIIRWRIRRSQHEFDATWFRLWIELASHGMVFFVWASYLAAIVTLVPLRDGLSLGSGLVFWLAVAAAWRAAQILWTVKRAVLDPPQESGIISANELPPGPLRDDGPHSG